MKTYRIALLPGDGIGKEVIPAGLEVLKAAAEVYGFRLETQAFPWGTEYYLEHGEMMPENGSDTLRQFDSIYLGAVGFPAQAPDHITLHGMMLKIRKELRQYVNVRPHRRLAGIQGPLRTTNPFDILVIRENSEGEYLGAGGRAHVGTSDEVAVETSIFTRVAVERALRYGFEQARTRRKILTSCTKSNAQRHTMVFWDSVTQEVAKEYPDVTVNRMHVDALSARFITHPHTLDVVVASNLFGDILTDIGAAIQGGLGFAASGNIDPTGKAPSMFEAVHGSAPDIYGKGIANPIATIWAGSMMLENLGETQAARAVMEAVETVTGEGRVATPDMGGTNSTAELTAAIVRAIK